MYKLLPQRKPLRLPGYNYAQNGAYFITICTKNRACLFGDVTHGEMVLNDAGHIIETEWPRTSVLRNDVMLDEFIIMPNHVHMIVLLSVGGDCIAPSTITTNPNPDGTMQSSPTTSNISYIIRGFKSATTKTINLHDQTSGTPVWQRGYHDHIIRNEADLNRIRQYIVNNPLQWHLDENNPEKVSIHV
ncbi:MAG: transposase [Vampirovibrionales bacterium]|nr:transposase [Vampirovibrionales bacterium]